MNIKIKPEVRPEVGKFLKYLRTKFFLNQEFIAKKIGISRPTLNKIEAEKADITLFQAKKLADFYNISLDDLLACRDNVNRNVRVSLRDELKDKTSKDIAIEITPQRFNRNKELVIYLLNRIGAKPQCSELFIYHLLFLIDYYYVLLNKAEFSGLTYLKNNYGPAPVEFEKMKEDMIMKEEVEMIHGSKFIFPLQKLLPLREADLKIFRADELKHIEQIIATAADLSLDGLKDRIGKIEQYLITPLNGRIELIKK